SLNVRPRQIARMAPQARVQHLLRIHQRKCPRDGGLPAVRFQVLLGRTVTTFAARLLRGLFARRDALVMRILVEVHPHVGMAGFTGVTARKLGLCSGRYSHQQQQQYTHLLSRSDSNDVRAFPYPDDSEDNPVSRYLWSLR